jgi:hypothetical protein
MSLDLKRQLVAQLVEVRIKGFVEPTRSVAAK